MPLPKAKNILLTVLILAIVVAAGLLIAQDQESLHVRSPIAADDPLFPDYLARILGRPVTSGDAYTVLRNGKDAFPAMIGAIENAKKRISFETYIYSPGEVADRFTAALAAACERGVLVQIVFDAVGSSDGERDARDTLSEAGCQIASFNPVRHTSLEEVNYRTHRKILVVDGQVGFVGGIGVADHWLGDAEAEDQWRDTQFEIRGPAVDYLEGGFHENWIEVGGIVEPTVSPREGPPAGEARSIVVWSSAEGGANQLKLKYLMAVAAARRSLDIQSPYFVTDGSTLWSLLEARQRGVRVRLLLEGDITDAKPVKFAGRAQYEPLLAAGVEIYEFQPTMMHTKAMVVDGTLSIIGSANFDNRSMELNDELNVLVAGHALAADLTRDFEADRKRSKRIVLEEWRARPLHIRGREKLWELFGELF